MKKNIFKFILIPTLTSFLLCGCGASSSSYETAAVYDAVNTNSYSKTASYGGALFSSDYKSADYYTEDIMEEESFDRSETKEVLSETQQYSQKETRKLIKTVNLDIQTKNFDNLTNRIESLVDENNGYIESANVDGQGYWGNNHRYANYTIRVPKDNISNIINSLDGLGVISSKSENVQDVTLSYYDQDSQKKALEVEQDRLMEILADAENMDQIIALESRLSEVRYQINSIGTNLKLIDNKVDYSTINLSVQEVDVEVAPKTEKKTVFETIAENWEQNIIDLKDFFEDLIINMTSNLGTIIFEIIVVVIIILIIKTKKKNKKKREEIKKKEAIANK